MNQRISILGCGWLGFALAIDLIGKGYKICGSTKSDSKIRELEKKGIKPFLIDIGQDHLDVSEFLMCDVLIIAVTSKSIQDFKNLLREVEKSKVRKVLFVSSTSVYPYTNGIVTEERQTGNTSLAEIEKLFIDNSTFESTIIRFGGLFGYDRKPGNFIKRQRLVDNPEGFINFIHRDDCIGIIERIIVKDIWNEILNACADTHPKRREFYLKEAAKLGQSKIVFNEQSKNEYNIINSQKMKNLLNYEFKYPDLINY